MPFEITNNMRSTSIVRAVDTGTYTITLNSLRANAFTETVTTASIKRVLWSTNGSILIVRNGVPILSLTNNGQFDLDHSGYTIANNSNQTISITITTGGSIVMELSKTATYNVDPFTGQTL